MSEKAYRAGAEQLVRSGQRVAPGLVRPGELRRTRHRVCDRVVRLVRHAPAPVVDAPELTRRTEEAAERSAQQSEIAERRRPNDRLS